MCKLFKNLCKNKPKEKVESTFEMYKKQMSNDVIKEVEKVIKDYYEK